MKIRKRAALNSGDIMEYKQVIYEQQNSIRAAKRAYSQKPEGCYLDNNTHSMWQGIPSVTNYRRNMNRTETRGTALPDNLNSFYARFDRLNRDIPSLYNIEIKNIKNKKV